MSIYDFSGESPQHASKTSGTGAGLAVGIDTGKHLGMQWRVLRKIKKVSDRAVETRLGTGLEY